MALDILQNRRGRLLRIVVDQLTAHVALKPNIKHVSPTLRKTIEEGMSHLITDKGFQITITDGQRHSKVGLAESAVHNLKKILIRTFPTKPTNVDLFEFNHKLALVESYINERPTFLLNDQYFTPHIFKIASIKTTIGPMSINSISDTIFHPLNS